MMPPDEKPLEVAIKAAWPVETWRESHLVLAVSGGADSVAMLRATHTLKQQSGGTGKLFVAHLNHGLRAAASEEDQGWLETLCRRLEMPLEVGRVDVVALAAAEGDGWEAAARKVRYRFLRLAAEKVGARFVAVAHTADDQAETVLHHIVRGTGLAGLTGMPVVRPLSTSVTLVRPLLAVQRGDVLHYLDSIGQDFRIDSSNADPRWTRNRLRNELLPTLRKHYNTAVDEALRRLARQAGEAQAFVSGACARVASRSVEIRSPSQGTRVRIDCRELRSQAPIVVREVCKSAWRQAGWPLQAMGFEEWQRLAELVATNVDTNSLNLPSGIRARREGEAVVMEQRARNETQDEC